MPPYTDYEKQLINDGHSPEGLSFDGVSPEGWSYDGKTPKGYSYSPGTPEGYSDPAVHELSQYQGQLDPMGGVTPEETGYQPPGDVGAEVSGMPPLSPEADTTGMPPMGGTVFGVPKANIFSIIGRGLGGIANAMDPVKKPGQAALDMFKEDEASRILETKYKVFDEANKTKMQKLIQDDLKKQRQSEGWAEIAKAKPGTPEFYAGMEKIAKNGGDISHLITSMVPKEGTPAYKSGHVQEFNTKEGTVYREWNGSGWKDRPDLGGKPAIPVKEPHDAYSVAEGVIRERDAAQGITRPVIPKTEIQKEMEATEIRKTEGKAVAGERGRFEAQAGFLDDKTLENIYQTLKVGGEFPQEVQRLYRAPGVSLKIAEYVARRQTEDGITGVDRALSRATYKADTQSLAATTKGMDSISAFEKGAGQSLSLLQKVADNYSRGKYPKANQFAQAFSYHTGDEDIKTFQNALQTSMTEYMKVINAGTNLTAAELSVMGQQRAKELLATADNPQTLKNAIAIMRQEMKISGDKLKTQKAEIENRIKGVDKISTLEPTIQKHALANGLDPDLIKNMIKAESGGDPFALSPKGAMGVMQLMPGTAKDLGVQDPNNPEQSISGGARYLAQQFKRFNSPVLALAAYNWGPEKVAANPSLSKAPPETVDYIKKVLGIDIRAGVSKKETAGNAKSMTIGRFQVEVE